jgi:hypothetical protein
MHRCKVPLQMLYHSFILFILFLIIDFYNIRLLYLISIIHVLDNVLSFLNKFTFFRYFDRDVECIFKFFSKRSVNVWVALWEALNPIKLIGVCFYLCECL